MIHNCQYEIGDIKNTRPAISSEKGYYRHRYREQGKLLTARKLDALHPLRSGFGRHIPVKETRRSIMLFWL